MSKNTYTLTPQNQLIDLNGDLVNFDLTFSAISKDGTPFKALVIDQITLDTNPELQHNIAENGSIGGNIVYDKNVPQNLFLILKIHEKPCEVEVTIDKKQIPANIPPPTQQNSESIVKSSNESNNIWKWILIGLAVLLFAFLVWQQYSSWKNKKSQFSGVNTELHNTSSVVVDSPHMSATLSDIPVSAPIPSSSPPINSGLLERLNRLSTKYN